MATIIAIWPSFCYLFYSFLFLGFFFSIYPSLNRTGNDDGDVLIYNYFKCFFKEFVEFCEKDIVKYLRNFTKRGKRGQMKGVKILICQMKTVWYERGIFSRKYFSGFEKWIWCLFWYINDKHFQKKDSKKFCKFFRSFLRLSPIE